MNRVPNKGNIAQSYQIGKPQHMSRINNQINKFFSEAEETQKGTMQQTR